MSRTWGMFSRITGSSVSKAAAMQGSAAFFAPLIRTVPSSGLPPRITSLSITWVAPEKLERRSHSNYDLSTAAARNVERSFVCNDEKTNHRGHREAEGKRHLAKGALRRQSLCAPVPGIFSVQPQLHPACPQPWPSPRLRGRDL